MQMGGAHGTSGLLLVVLVLAEVATPRSRDLWGSDSVLRSALQECCSLHYESAAVATPRRNDLRHAIKRCSFAARGNLSDQPRKSLLFSSVAYL